MSYTKYKRGSEWRKWDLHFHTPSSYDYENMEVTNEEIIESLVEKEIAVVAITDHHKIDINRIKKLQDIANGRITILPGIEFLCESRGSEPLHFIGIFDQNSNLTYIWDQIKNRTSIKKIEGESKAINEVYCHLEDTIKLIKELGGIVSIHAGSKANGLENITHSLPHGVAQKEDISKVVDIFELGKESDISGYQNIVLKHLKKTINKTLPLILCSDNHNIRNYFVKQTLWIKADPTFEGLKQIIYEPEDRVKIQALKPDLKNERYIISELQFLDSGKLFGNQNVMLNENLNAIIGGKSSGKSLILYSTAKSIDPEQVHKASMRLGFEGYSFDSSYDFKVTWKNGDIDLLSKTDFVSKLHEITFIPQLYINYLVEKNNKDELNALVKNILLQDTPFRLFFDENTNSIAQNNSEIQRLLNEYFKVRNNALDIQRKSKDTGSSTNIKNSIVSIETEISKGQKASNLSDVEFDEYNSLLRIKAEIEAEKNQTDLKISVLNKVLNEIQASKSNLLGKTDSTSQIYLKGQVDRILDELGELPPEINLIKSKLDSDFDLLINNYKAEFENLELNKKKADILKRAEENIKKLEPFLTKLTGQKELQKLTAQLESEKLKFQNAIALESQLKSLTDEYNNIRKQISVLIKSRLEFYRQIVTKVNETRKNIGSDIELKASLVCKTENFPLFEQVNKAAISSDHYFKTLFEGSMVNYEKIADFFGLPLKVTDDKLYYGKDDFIPLRTKTGFEDVLRGLVKDLFEIDYSVTYNNDNLLAMSPGKKGTVLLILFLEISTSEYPILIDQPEDNLDNRTIYDLLCKMIKKKKQDRQIIIVSHNANLVVATDSENIIVANQQGKETALEPDRYRFEYVNGSLEHSFISTDPKNSVLLSQGIREHVCDILEGGGEAFKQRERKYSL